MRLALGVSGIAYILHFYGQQETSGCVTWSYLTPGLASSLSPLSFLSLLEYLFYLAPVKLDPLIPLTIQNVRLLFCHFPSILDLSVSTCQWLFEEWPLEPWQ